MNDTKGASTTTDRIEKKVLLRAPRSKVWRAISDSAEFVTGFYEGRWTFCAGQKDAGSDRAY